MDLAKQALMLLAVDPALGGVVIPSAVGSGKSTLARAFADILPEGTPFVELPLNVTEDRLIGGVDTEIRRFVAAYVAEAIDSPASQQAKVIDVSTQVASAWDAG
jgi:ABC-type glutathione transport system ATPase component